MKCVRGQACRQQVNSLTLGRHQTQRLGLLFFFVVVVCFFVWFFFRRCPMRAVRQLATLDKWMCAPPACLNLCSLCTCALLDCDRYGQVRAFLEIWMCDFVCTLLDSANALLDCWTTTYAHFREYKQEVCGGQYH